MAEKITYTHLPGDPCLTQEQIFRYIDGTLLPAEMHAVEKHLLDCAFCSDALEGLQLTRERSKAGAFIPFANGKEEKGNKDENEPKTPIVLPLFQRRSTWYAIAATVTLIIGVTTFMKLTLSSPEMAKDSSGYAQVTISNGDKKTADSSSPSSPDESRQDSIAVSGNSSYIDEQRQESANTSSKLQNAQVPVKDAEADKQEITLSQKAAAADEDAPANGAATVASGATTVYAASNEKQKDVLDDRLASKPKLEEAKNQPVVTESNYKSPGTQGRASKKDAKTRSGAKKESVAGTAGDYYSGKPAAQAPPTAGGVSEAEDVKVISNDAPQEAAPDTIVRLYPLKASDKDLDLSYENGVKMLDAGQTSASIVFFDEVLKNPAHHYYQDAQWKKAEALIKLNRKEEAKKLLNEIITGGGKYKDQAQEKLKTL